MVGPAIRGMSQNRAIFAILLVLTQPTFSGQAFLIASNKAVYGLFNYRLIELLVSAARPSKRRCRSKSIELQASVIFSFSVSVSTQQSYMREYLKSGCLNNGVNNHLDSSRHRLQNCKFLENIFEDGYGKAVQRLSNELRDLILSLDAKVMEDLGVA